MLELGVRSLNGSVPLSVCAILSHYQTVSYLVPRGGMFVITHDFCVRLLVLSLIHEQSKV